MKSITLTGMSGSGKTTVATLIASRLNFGLADIDSIIEKEENKTINEIFSTNGEKYFRDLEEKIINNLTGKNLVISLGGGAFEREKTRNLLLENTTVFYLKTCPETILERLKETTDRPLLNNISIERISGLLSSREKHYKLAHHTILTDNKSLEEIAEEILKCLN